MDLTINMRQYPLVTILTPCYNTGSLVHRLLESVLNQDYPAIEMITIDDGSIDNTAEVIKSYIHRFEEKGYILRYYYQENQGQSSAINNGLKLVNGSFLTWPDSDDWFRSSKAISMLAGTLERSSKDVAIVRCQQIHATEANLAETYVTGRNYDRARDNFLFYDCLFGENGFWLNPGGYMVKFDALRKTTDLEIYIEKNAGQNWQLLLPLLYDYKCITIPEILFTIFDRKASHSRGQYAVSLVQQITLAESYENTLLATLCRIRSIGCEERKELIDKIKRKYILNKLSLSIHYNNQNYEAYYWNKLKQECISIPYKAKVLHYLFITHLYNILKRYR